MKEAVDMIGSRPTAPTADPMSSLTIGSLLNAALVGSAERKIVYRDQPPISYHDLRERVGRLASLLRDRGVGPGDTVAMLDWDSDRYLASYFAVPMMGAVLQTVNVRLSPDQIRYTLQQSRARILIIHRDFAPLVEAIRHDLPDVRDHVVITEGARDALPGWAGGSYEDLLARSRADFPFDETLDENNVATTFYTTGTTGLPKGVCFTHRQLVLHSLSVAAALGADGQIGYRDVYMPLTPMFHVHAWGFPYVATMLGLTQIYPGRYEPSLIVDLHQRHGVTLSHCVPTVLRMVMDTADSQGIKFDGWKMLIGGSVLSPDLLAAAQAAGLRVLAGYGMSETGPVVSLMRASVPPESGHSAARSGYPIPLVTVSVVDDAMQPVPRDDRSHGELVVRSPWLTPGYVGDATASAQLWHGGWLHTQDVATLHEDGALQIRDRIKDVIKSGGEWICSQTLETLILAEPDVAQVAVVGVPHPQWQERPVAFIVPRAGARPDITRILLTVDAAVERGEISRYARLDHVEIVEDLPLTSVGKIDKKAIREWSQLG
ncbi:long-chain-fatty-acid--CoA ligase [Niveispirillum fermenti]|uniref:long-chain-fatty-acid--CoA ligase n=2 Tax=Niveispirillum fermenti TaxID=1233113 RepID=UPI003A87FE95